MLRGGLLFFDGISIHVDLASPRDGVATRMAFNLLRTVAIEFGTCRSGRNGGAPGPISFRNCSFLEQRGGGCI